MPQAGIICSDFLLLTQVPNAHVTHWLTSGQFIVRAVTPAVAQGEDVTEEK